ncbi:class I SAM-dependent methyltransferase [bacterium]|nr:class I SAM-dependent methyltransferase [bacterium]
MTYEEDLQDEAAFWAHFNSDALARGTPHWLDLQNATRIDRRPYNPFNDHRIENALRGSLKKNLLDQAGIGPGRGLDFGCGIGWLALELARRGFEMDAIDLAPDSIEIAKTYAKEQGMEDRIHHFSADLGTYPLPQQTYDVVAIWDVLHHLPDPEGALQRIKESLLPGGRLIILDHLGFDSSLGSWVKWLDRLLPIAPHAFFSRIRRRLGWGESPSPPSPVVDAPFEHCSEESILPAIEKVLPGAHISSALPIGIHLAHHHEAPVWCAPLVWTFVAFVDRFLLSRGASGEYLTVVWVAPNDPKSD